MSDDLKDAIKESAQGPKKASGDGVSAEQHPLPDQIEADKYLAAKEAKKNPVKAFTRVKIVPPGAV